VSHPQGLGLGDSINKTARVEKKFNNYMANCHIICLTLPLPAHHDALSMTGLLYQSFEQG